MRIKKARQILKSFADDTRLRLVNLLSKKELNVTELCRILQSSQSNISKHLSRLRLTGVVGDRREGSNIYYYLVKPEEKSYKELLNAVTVGLAGLEIFKEDLQRLKKIEKESVKIKKNLKGDGRK